MTNEQSDLIQQPSEITGSPTDYPKEGQIEFLEARCQKDHVEQPLEIIGLPTEHLKDDQSELLEESCQKGPEQ